MKALGCLALPIAGVLVLVFVVVVVLAPGGSSPALGAATSCLPQPQRAVTGVHLDDQQRRVVHTIVSVGRSLHVAPRGWVIALSAGMQESGLRPLPDGDRDSLGVFQQRTAWGPVHERMNPRTSARMFFTGGHGGQPGLLDVPDWGQLSIAQAAQAVQVSAYPNAYAKWTPLAIRLVHKLTTADAVGCTHTDWVFPLGNTAKVLTAGFGSCGSLWSHCHTGQDFAAPVGTPVAAAGTGVVTFAGRAGAYGNLVEVLHSGGVATWYAHLSRIDTRRGGHVHAGQLLGLVGATGNTTGPHLHFEVRLHASVKDSGTPIDPLPWLRSHHLM
ncbi:MAG TPA: M23 family metallopeptidase [Arthrobacter sp.]|nr:M23 family metallopeptidase [Arthrobacter sp.]